MNIENNSIKKFRSTGLVVASFLSFFIFGFSDVLKGTAIPEIIAETSFGYNTGGALIGFTYFGFFAGTLSSVFSAQKMAGSGSYGSRRGRSMFRISSFQCRRSGFYYVCCCLSYWRRWRTDRRNC